VSASVPTRASETAPRVGQEGASGLGQSRAAAYALEQWSSQLLLEQAEAPADGGLGTVQPMACARKATGLGDGEECSQLVDFHDQEN